MLAASTSASDQELLGVLEVVVVAGLHRIFTNDRGDDVSVGETRAIMHGHDADQIVLTKDGDGLETLPLLDDHRHLVDLALVVIRKLQTERLSLREDGEHGRIDRSLYRGVCEILRSVNQLRPHAGVQVEAPARQSRPRSDLRSRPPAIPR
jgi:hypothetical protein